MKNFIKTGIFLLSFASVAAFAHHPAADIVDEEVYEMIDSMVADTPHADLTFDSMGSSTEINIASRSIVDLENLMDDGLVSYAAMLDGDVTMTIDFNQDSSIDVRISQAAQ